MTTNTNTTKTTSGSGGGIGSKIKGAGQVIHGLGENIRGTALGTADRVARSETSEKLHNDVAMKGREEFAQGMERIKGHAPQPAGTTQAAAPGGTGTGTGAEVSGATGAQAAGAGVTGQGPQERNEASAAEGRSGVYSGPATTGSGAAQTGHDGREAFAGTGAVPGQEKQVQRDPGFASTQEGKGYDQGAQERSRPVDTHRDRGQGATDDRFLQRSEQPSQQMAGEQPTTGQIQHGSLQQEGQQGIQKGTGEDQRGQMNFQGIPQDD